jgi:hypothetical protein
MEKFLFTDGLANHQIPMPLASHQIVNFFYFVFPDSAIAFNFRVESFGQKRKRRGMSQAVAF